jgi:hypothetical protein
MKNDNEIIEKLIAEGLISKDLVILLDEKEGQEIDLGILTSASALATYRASELSKELKIQMYVKENSSLFLLENDGSKKFIKKIKKPLLKPKKNFKII